MNHSRFTLHVSRFTFYVSRFLMALALLTFVGYFVVYTIYAVELFRFPFDYDQGEGFELMDTVLFSQGEWPYRDNDTYPFYSSNYPPLFHVVIVPLVWLFGPHYWTGRLVAYVGTLITAVFISYAVYRENKQGWLSAVCGLAFLASNYVYHVGPLFRQHLFMVMFETVAVVGITAVLEAEERGVRSEERGVKTRSSLFALRSSAFSLRPSPGLLLVMFLLLCAGYTKQLAYATVTAVFIFFFLRQPKRAVLWAVPFAVVTGLIFLWINWSTDGLWLLNTVTANLNPFIREQAIGLYRQWFTLHIVLTTVAGLFAAYQLYFDRLSAYSIWFVVAAANGVTAGKWGAGESYFATAIAASCIVTGLAFGRLLKWAESHQPSAISNQQSAVSRSPIHHSPFTIHNLPFLHLLPALFIPLLFLIQANQVFHMPTHTPLLAGIARALGKPTEVYIAPQTSCSEDLPPERIPYVDSAGVSLLGRPPNAADTAAGIQIAQLIAEGETAAFAEDAGFNFYLGRDIITNPTQLLNLYNNGAVDLTEMLGMLDRQEFDTIVLRAQFYPPPVLDMIGQRYETTNLVQMNGFVYCVMRPR